MLGRVSAIVTVVLAGAGVVVLGTTSFAVVATVVMTAGVVIGAVTVVISVVMTGCVVVITMGSLITGVVVIGSTGDTFTGSISPTGSFCVCSSVFTTSFEVSGAATESCVAVVSGATSCVFVVVLVGCCFISVGFFVSCSLTGVIIT